MNSEYQISIFCYYLFFNWDNNRHRHTWIHTQAHRPTAKNLILGGKKGGRTQSMQKRAKL